MKLLCVDRKDFPVSAVQGFVQRGSTDLVPSHLKFHKAIMSVALEVAQKSPIDPAIDVFSENLTSDAAESFFSFQKRRISSYRKRNFLDELALHSGLKLSIWEGTSYMQSKKSTASEQKNLQGILSSTWDRKFQQSALPFHSLIVEEKSGRFSNLAIQKNTYEEWRKKEIRKENGYGLVAFFQDSQNKSNVIWHKYDASHRLTDPSFARSFIPWLMEEVDEESHGFNWDQSHVWIESDNELFLGLISEYGGVGAVSLKCPQICYGYNPQATFAASLQNFEPQIFVHAHSHGELDIAIIS